jgi:hypothetical protein
MNLVVIVADWLALLDARAHGKPWSSRLGKVERPPLRTIPREHADFRSVLASALPGAEGPRELLYVVCHGRLRASVELTALRHTVDGWDLDVGTLSSLRPVTIHQPVPSWWRGWKETWWKDWPAEETRGGVAGDEVTFVTWATADLPTEVQARAEALWRRVTRPAPAPGPPAAPAASRAVTAPSPSVAASAPAAAPAAPRAAKPKQPATSDRQLDLWGVR